MATTVTMLDPTGTPRQIPADQKDAALKAGGKVVLKMTDPTGTARWVPEDQKEAAIKAGGKLATTTTVSQPTNVDSTPPPSTQKEPGIYDKVTGSVLNFFRPLSADERQGIESHLGKVLGPIVEGVGNAAMGAAQGTGSLVFHPLSSIYSSAQTAADAVNQLFPDSKLSPQQKKAKDASLARLKDQWQQVKDNPDFALGNLFGSIESGKIIGETVAGVPRKLINAAKKTPEAIHGTAQTIVGAGERQVRAAVETEAAKANTAAQSTEASNRGAEEDTLKAQGKIDEANLAARKDTKSAATAAQKAANSSEPYLSGDKIETSARQLHDAVVDRQKTVEAKRQSLSDDLEHTRQEVYSRLQNVKAAARAHFSQAYGEIEKAGGGKGVELETLVNDAEEAREHVKGSEDSLKVFNDLESRFNHPVTDISKPPNSDISKEEWTQYSKEDKEHAWRDALQEEGAGATIPLEDLNGYYSELGRVAASKSTPGDLKAAAKAMQKSIDDRIQETYGDELFKKNLLVRTQYRTFAQHFLDQDSPLTRAVDAPDYYHGTQTTFLTPDARQPAVRARVRTMLTGDAKDPSTQYLGKEVAASHARDPETGKMAGSGETIPAWRYRRQTHQQIEHLRDLQRGLDALPTSEKLAKDMADSTKALATARETARTTAAAKPLQKPYNEPSPITPVEVPEVNTRKIREDFVKEKLAQWTSVSKFQLARLVAGPIGIVVGVATGHPWLEAGAAIYTGAELTPFALQKLLDRPGVREWFTRPPADEIDALQKVPYADRVKIADGLRGMIREADKQGKPIRLSRLVIAFIAANTRPQQSQQGPDQSVGLEDLEQLNNDLDQPTSDQTAAPQDMQP